MLGLILGIGIPLLYFLIGYKLAVMDMPRQWELANNGGVSRSFIRSEVLTISAITFFFWPVRGPLIVMGRAAEKVNPDRIREQSRKIKELERELGINATRDTYSDPYGSVRRKDRYDY